MGRNLLHAFHTSSSYKANVKGLQEILLQLLCGSRRSLAVKVLLKRGALPELLASEALPGAARPSDRDVWWVGMRAEGQSLVRNQGAKMRSLRSWASFGASQSVERALWLRVGENCLFLRLRLACPARGNFGRKENMGSSRHFLASTVRKPGFTWLRKALGGQHLPPLPPPS